MAACAWVCGGVMEIVHIDKDAFNCGKQGWSSAMAARLNVFHTPLGIAPQEGFKRGVGNGSA